MAILTPALLLLAVLVRLGQERSQQMTMAASVGLGMIGCFWLVERVLA